MTEDSGLLHLSEVSIAETKRRKNIPGMLGLVNAMTKEYYIETSSLREDLVSGDLSSSPVRGHDHEHERICCRSFTEIGILDTT